MTHYLLSVHGPAERNEFGGYGSKEDDGADVRRHR